MARRKRFRRFRRRKRRSYQSRLADKKINTLVEKRAKDIAQKEVKKRLLKNYVIGEYGSYFSSGQPRIWNQVRSEPVPWTIAGGFLPAANSPTQPALRIPLSANQAIGGLSFATMPQGQRRTNKIYVTGFKMTGMFRKKCSAAYSNVDWVAITLMESPLKFNAFPSASQLASVVGASRIPPAVGFMEDETDQDAIQYSKQQRVLHRQVYKITTPDAHVNGLAHRTFTFQKYFKKPKMIFYDDSDTTGSSPWNRLLWCTVQASGINEDATSNQSMGQPTTESPEICACVKLFYHEVPT